jgi:hypothetical protein
VVKKPPIENKETILVYDYSTDGTREINKDVIEPHT